MSSRSAPTLLELCAARATRARGGDPAKAWDSLRAAPLGLRVCERVIEWAMATVEASEHEVATTVEYAEYWGITERGAWLHRARIRELFPGDEFYDVVGAIAREQRARRVGAAELRDVPVRTASLAAAV